eukprot:283099_1
MNIKYCVIPYIQCTFNEFMTSLMLRMKYYWVKKSRKITIDVFYDFKRYKNATVTDYQTFSFGASSICKNLHITSARNVSFHTKNIYIPMFRFMLTKDISDKRIPDRTREENMGGHCFMDPIYRDVTSKGLIDFKDVVFRTMDVTNTEEFDLELKKIVNKYRKEFMGIYQYPKQNITEEELISRKNAVYTKFMSVALSQAVYALVRGKGFTKPFVPTRTRFKCDHINAGKHTNPKKR